MRRAGVRKTVMLTGDGDSVAAEVARAVGVDEVCANLLPEDKDKKIRGINNRVFFAIGSALGFALFEIFLASTPAFIWVYKWWGFLPVFITTYIPFFLVSYLVYDMPRDKQKKVVGTLWICVAILLIVLIPLGVI